MAFDTLFFNSTAAITVALQVAIVVRMYKTNLWQELRMFFAYTLFCVFRTALLVALRDYFGPATMTYLTAYWMTTLVDTALAFYVIQEVYAHVLCRYDGLRALSRVIFRWAFAMLVLLAVIIAIALPAVDADPVLSAITLFDRSAMIVELGLVVLLFVLAKALSLGWRECVFGIAAGMCLFCSLDLAAITLRAHYGPSVALLYSGFKSMAYVITVAVWTVYMYRSERSRNREIMPFHSETLEAWNAAVLEFLNR